MSAYRVHTRGSTPLPAVDEGAHHAPGAVCSTAERMITALRWGSVKESGSGLRATPVCAERTGYARIRLGSVDVWCGVGEVGGWVRDTLVGCQRGPS